ncbi:hypothetical protein A0H81_06190 [Grifola frondosa]|uniref:BTB domain-containing protein n=1 Tax=Grifola frondosa TaxID=5627 RepID=A0A1C7MA77_GRIFR|nr:hypothetical protein A0H81_06190 [Grifola frondosa]
MTNMNPKEELSSLDEPQPISSLPEQTSVNFSASTEVWYLDGSVVVVSGETAFRVHQTILSANCEAFKVLFTVPQPEKSDSETCDGCPVVRLQDTADDLKHFFKAMYDISYFLPGVRNKFAVVAAVLRLSTKYDASHLRKRAINLLTSAYPSTLLAWDDRLSNRLIPPFENEHATYMALALETRVRIILPAVYFAWSRQPLLDALRDLVDIEIAATILIGRERLQRAEISHILAFLQYNYPRPLCQNVVADNQILARTTAAALAMTTEHEPYHQWCSSHPSEVGESLGLCANCCLLVESTIQKGRSIVWEKLPGFFDLPDWETLLAEVHS